MTTATAPLESPRLPGCPVCNGAGWDPDFKCPCNCTAFMTPTLRSALAERTPDRIITNRDRPQGDGTGHATGGNPWANKYPGTCIKCGTPVPALAGLRVRDGQGWATSHNLHGCPPKDAATAAPVPVGRRNRFAGPCHLCNTPHAAETALLVKVAGSWAVQCDGPCPEVAAGTLDLSPLKRYTSAGTVRFGVPGMDTRLKVQLDFPAGRWDGTVFVRDAAAYGAGRKYGRQNPGGAYRGDITDELAAILADPMGALRKYGELTSRCGVCNRALEDKLSVERGIGPWCWARVS